MYAYLPQPCACSRRLRRGDRGRPREPCTPATTRYGLHTLRAAVSHANIASQHVLLKAGFTATGPADLGGSKAGTWYQRALPTNTP